MAVRRRYRALAWAVALAGGVAASQAGAEVSAELLREGVATGELAPLSEVFDALEADYRGSAVAVRLEPGAGPEDGPVYAIQWLGPDGQLVDFRLDARTGELRSVEGVGLRELRRP